jgi:hypothetical protein
MPFRWHLHHARWLLLRLCRLLPLLVVCLHLLL